jgi:transcriptional regulator with XRE-family HTH domain
MSIAKRSARMGAETDYGRKQPNGRKIMELRKGKGLKQEDFAEDISISVRLLGDIERKNHPVPASTITAIAAKVKVNPSDITLSTPDAKAGSLLKLRVVRSATELSALAAGATKYEWRLKIDPSTATAADMQAVMTIVKRLVAESYGTLSGPSVMEAFGIWGPVVPKFIMPPIENLDDSPENVQDEFDKEEFGDIPRLARLQDLVTRLGTNGVNVIAGTYTCSWLRSRRRKNENPNFDQIWVRVPRETTERIFETELVLSIHFVPSDVEEEVVPIKTGPSLEELERVDAIPF